MFENLNILPVVVFMLKGLASMLKQSNGYFVTSITTIADLWKILLFKCIKIISEHYCQSYDM